MGERLEIIYSPGFTKDLEKEGLEKKKKEWEKISGFKIEVIKKDGEVIFKQVK